MSSLAMVATPLRLSGRVAAPSARRTLVVKASAQADRRKVLGGLAAGAALFPAAAALAVKSIIVDDSRSEKGALDRVYEAFDGDADIRTRRGELQYRSSLSDTKARVQESRNALKDVVNGLEKGYWTESQNQLRRQTGYLRYDLDNLVNSASNPDEAKQVKRDFLAQVDQLDLAIRYKNMDRAMAAYDRVLSSLDSIMGMVGTA
ncbi:hypothetical protein BSKO_04290 [Bryopsis sp. KO-2023]|nr:hypothetical protein BSKO_04290 [Bryopsis sp. KO-2023]